MCEREKIKYLNNMKPIALSNHQIIRIAKIIEIPYFRGVFLRDELPPHPLEIEAGILNLDNSIGTHWVGWLCNKRLNLAVFLDAFGALEPPPELYQYLREYKYVRCNYDKFQFNFNDKPSMVCGQWTLFLLLKLSHFLK